MNDKKMKLMHDFTHLKNRFYVIHNYQHLCITQMLYEMNKCVTFILQNS